ncbi:MAG TPA: hypothetical protein VKE94_11365 [Gemmataceae bacterium]|nr:hypothetical protein [Gemmataceae bacterium]
MKRSHFRACPQQPLDFGPEPRVSGAGMLQESRPLLRRLMFDRRQKD